MDKAEKIMNLAVRRGFFWPAYEIYGGVAGMYVWGPLGIVLKRKITSLWREFFIDSHNFFEIQTPSISPYIVFKASGHVESFKDIMLPCSKCGKKFRADTLLKEKGIEVSENISLSDVDRIVEEKDIRCPICGGKLLPSSYFTTMFQTTIGPYKEAIGFLRPETAQGMFVEFKRIYEIFRRRFPVGVAQIGRGFRNEISPRQGPIRLREFDMMELEYFFDPENPKCPYINDVIDEELNILHVSLIKKGIKEYEKISVEDALSKGIIKNECMAYFMVLAVRFLELLGVPREKQRFREKLEGEKAHYAVQTFDQEVFLARWGWVEVSGHANRTNYDLSSHIKESGGDLYVYRHLDKPKKIKVIKIRPLPNKIKKVFKEKIGDIMSALSEMDEDMIWSLLSSKGYIDVTGIRLGKEFFDIKFLEKIVYVEKFIPHVIEPSFGLDRIAYAILEYSYKEKDDRVILSLPSFISPYDLSLYPLVEDDKLVKTADELREYLSNMGYKVLYDIKESIGRRYARADEIGVPVAITIDYQTLNDNTVTVRDRDTWKQYRIKKDNLGNFLESLLQGNSFSSIVESMNLISFNLKE